MPDVDIATRTQASTLHLELGATETLLRARDVHPSDVGNELTRAGTLCAMAYSTAIQRRGELEFHEDYEPKLIRAQFGSPLQMILEIPSPVLEYVAAMSLLVYAAKRVWGLPLEFKAHNQKLLTRFHRASADAVEAERRHELALRRAENTRLEARGELDSGSSAVRRRGAIEAGERRAIAGREEAFREIDQERKWRASATSEIETLRTEEWGGISGSWQVED